MARKPLKNTRRRPDSPRSADGVEQSQPGQKEPGRGNVGGRPPIEVTADHLRQIEQLAGYGLTEAAIAHVIGVSPHTFTRRKRDHGQVLAALEKGKSKAEGIVGQALFNRAKNGDLGAIVWWEKTRGGRVDSSQVRHADAKGENLPAPQVLFYAPDNGRGARLGEVPVSGNGRNGQRTR